MKKQSRIFNSLRALKNKITTLKISGSISVSYRADGAATDPAEMMLYDEIGKDPWTGAGITATDFKKALDAVKGRPLMLRINSMGGDVFQGVAIKNMLDEWPQDVSCKIDGIAASTASFIPMGCDKIVMAKGAQMFIHDAWGVCQGNAEDMQTTADQLDQTSDQIARMYSERSGQSISKMRGLMQEESLLTDKQCKDLGLCDDIGTDKSQRNFTPEEISSIKAKLETLHAVTNSVSAKAQAGKQQQQQNNNTLVMNRIQMLALLKAHGITPPDTETDAEILARCLALKPATPPTTPPQNNRQDTTFAPEQIADIQAQNKEMKKFMDETKRQRIVMRVDKFVSDDVIPLGVRDEVVTLAMENEKTLDVYDKMPGRAPGAENLRTPELKLESEAFGDIQNYILENGPRFTARMCALNPLARAGRGITATAKDVHAKALLVANTIAKHRNTLVQMFNTNTIDAELQRTVILNDLVRAFATRLLPLSAFTRTSQSVPLEGTDKVAVPYFALQTAASTDWVAANGYVTGDTAQSVRDVTINKRKYQAMAFTSQELRRQPYQNWQQLAMMNAEKLGVDVNADVLSIITVANYGASVKAVPGAAFSGDDVVDLFSSATDLNWPEEGRTLVLTTPYMAGLLKDPTFKYVLNAGTDDALRRASIKSAYRFDNIHLVPTANFPRNNENLTGFIAQKNAAAVATAPIMPGPAVRALMVQYDLAIDPINNVTIEYKLMGDAFRDKTAEIVESNYGYNYLVQTALARITDQ